VTNGINIFLVNNRYEICLIDDGWSLWLSMQNYV